jgi:acyl-CoA oxidase
MVDEMHAISSVLKAKSSWFASDVIRECRQMMGGSGYSSYSRLGSMYHDNDINKTWEGDNTVLLQQGTKFVLEAAQNITKGQPVEIENLKFLSEVSCSMNLAT